MKILFWLYKSRINSVGRAPIMIRFTHEGRRISVSSNIFISIKLWDSTRQRIKGSSIEVTEYNKMLETYKSKALQLFSENLRRGDAIDLNGYIHIITGKNKPVITLQEAIHCHIQQMKTRLGLDISANTIKKYETLQRKIDSFLKYKKVADPTLYQLTRIFIEELDTYMRWEENLSHNGVAKNMQQLKRVIRVCIKNQYLEKDPFIGYSCVVKPTDREYLTSMELKEMTNQVN